MKRGAFVIFLLFYLISCNNDKDIIDNPLPQADTLTVDSSIIEKVIIDTLYIAGIGNNYAVVECKLITPKSGDSSFEYGIELSTDSAFTDDAVIKITSKEPIYDNSTISFKVNDLRPNGVYYYRIYIVYRNKEKRSAVQSFKTSPLTCEYVDLGLSVNWATCNVGANAPEEYGDYYAWGETEIKSTYDWASYKWTKDKTTFLLKFNTSEAYGTIDNKYVLDPEDDVVHVLYGDNWHLPTNDEWLELQKNCNWEWTTINGINGFKITSLVEGYQGQFIFIPAAGYKKNNSIELTGANAFYWSSNLNEDYPITAQTLGIDSTMFNYNAFDRCCGLTVRPVCQSKEWFSNISITISEESKLIFPGYSFILSANTQLNSKETFYPCKWKWYSENPRVASVDNNGLVIGVSAGTTNIICSLKTLSVKCEVNVVASEADFEHEYVDLGLSVKWAAFNVGAIKPEDYGDYFAWGETEPYYEAGYAQEQPQAHWKEGKSDGYYWPSYKWCNDSYNTISKYCNNGDYGNEGFIDTLIELTPDDDVAHIKWGGNWRMPTKAEQDELRNKCTWIWYSSDNTEFNGVSGYKITNDIEGYTDRFIFLPAAGYRYKTNLSNVGSRGNYWSSTLYTGYPCRAYSFYSRSVSGYNNYSSDRILGYSVRPVCQ